ncbi:hypothetical protein RJT34_02672 [Clitoria ternatea]|uniref:ZF-HD dimerization-type domain-containing protein n=1 Tax=Clitoria ternatea TaxID=43366 RepID=A0AAN9Q1U0_CLITE
MDSTPHHNIDAADNTKTTPPPPQLPTQPTNNNNDTPKSLSFTNGTLKRHPATPAPPPSMVVSYKECLKNHAASIGGHALDGCGEFMPSSSIIPSDPRSLKCAACGCHRNFHRRDPQEHNNIDNNSNLNINNISNPAFLNCIYNTPSAPPPPPPQLPHRAITPSTSPSMSSSPSHSPSPISSPSPPPLSHLPPSYPHTSAPHMLLALGTAYSAAAPSDDHHQQQQQHHHHKGLNFSTVILKNENPSGKKRYRTKFSKEQKDKMQSFSEKLGWRMQKCDDGLVREFCNDIGVSRGVFKVWMHNNKNTFRKKSDSAPQIEKTNGGGGGNAGSGFDSDINNPYNPNISTNNSDIHMNEDTCVNVHVSLNGLSTN